MANNYSQCAALTDLKCSEIEFDELFNLLYLDEDNEPHGFALEYDDRGKSAYMYAEEYMNTENLPSKFLEQLGNIIDNNKLEYLEFGYAYTCDKMRMGEFGGGYFRIASNGEIIFPTLTWNAA